MQNLRMCQGTLDLSQKESDLSQNSPHSTIKWMGPSKQYGGPVLEVLSCVFEKRVDSRALARKLGLALPTVSKWEQGVTSPSPLDGKTLKRKEEKKRVSLHPKSHELVPHGWKDGMMPTQR